MSLAMSSEGGVCADPRNLIVNYIPTPVTDAELRQLFEQFGEVESARIIVDRVNNHPKGYGFVKFKHEAAALEAINKMNGFEIHQKRLKVTTARGPIGYVDSGKPSTMPGSGVTIQRPAPSAPPPPPPAQPAQQQQQQQQGAYDPNAYVNVSIPLHMLQSGLGGMQFIPQPQAAPPAYLVPMQYGAAPMMQMMAAPQQIPQFIPYPSQMMQPAAYAPAPTGASGSPHTSFVDTQQPPQQVSPQGSTIGRSN